MLQKMLEAYQPFQQYPAPQKAILLTLAQKFESDTDALFLTPEELQSHFSLGTETQWKKLLELEPTHNFIKAQMANMAQIASRKAFQALAQKAESGDVQAAKQINEISGLLSQQDNNKIVVLTTIPRPKGEDK